MKKLFAFAKLNALLEYLDFLQNFHAKKFHDSCLQKNYFTTKIKQITVYTPAVFDSNDTPRGIVRVTLL